MKTKNIKLLFVIMLMLLATCSAFASNFSITVNNYSFKEVVSGAFGMEYKADPGYTWLELNITIKNITKRDASITIMDNFYLITENEYEYERKLAMNSIPDEIPTSYPPQDHRTGNIYFHVPVGAKVGTSKLIFQAFNAKSDIYSLKDVKENKGLK